MEVCSKSLGAVLEYWYFERVLLPVTVQVWDLNHVSVQRWSNVIFLHNKDDSCIVMASHDNQFLSFQFNLDSRDLPGGEDTCK